MLHTMDPPYSLIGLSLKLSIFHGEQLCQFKEKFAMIQLSHSARNSYRLNPDVGIIEAYTW